jgi:MFS family permease
MALNAYWFGVSFMWNALHPIVLPVLLLSFSTEGSKNTSYGLLTFLGMIVALLVQPISGALSDATRHRLGRRRPWIIAGTLLDFVFLAALVTTPNYWTMALAYVMLQFSSNLAHGPGQGLIPDLVPADRRGAASGAKSALEMAGTIAAALVAGRLMSGVVLRPGWMMAAISGVLLVGLGITCVGARETPLPTTSEDMLDGGRRRATLAQLTAALRVDLRGLPDYRRLLLSRFCLFLGTYSVQAFGLYYFRDVHHAAEPARMVSAVMTAIALAVLASAYPAGALSERWGRKRLSLAACGLAAVGMAALALTQNPASFWALGVAIGLGMGIFSSVNWAWATDLIPLGEAGKYLGLSNLATAGAAAISRLLGPIIDLANHYAPNAGYTLLFILATVGALAALAITMHISERRPAQEVRQAHQAP